MKPRPDPVHVVKSRREAALAWLTGGIPYAQFLGIRFDRRGDELTSILPFDERLIGNPALPALHGGATAAFLEMTASIELAWTVLWQDLEAGRVEMTGAPALPKTISFTVDFLRSGLPRDAYARAKVNRVGRRYASVHIEAWQDNRDRPHAMATAHFLMPPLPGQPAE